MTRRLSPSPPSSKLFSSKGSSIGQSNDKKQIKSASISFGKLQKSFADASATSLMVGAANAPRASSHFATIDVGTTMSEDIPAVVVASMTIAITTTVGLPTGHRNANMETARFAISASRAKVLGWPRERQQG